MSASLNQISVEEVEEPLVILKSNKTTKRKPRQKSTVKAQQEAPKKTQRRKVSFDMDVQIVDFSTKSPPLLTFMKYPSCIDSLSKEQITSEAVNSHIVKSENDIHGLNDYNDIKERIRLKWKDDLITETQFYDIHLDPQSDELTIENQYKLFKSLLRSATIFLYHPKLFPQELTREQLEIECEKNQIQARNKDRYLKFVFFDALVSL